MAARLRRRIFALAVLGTAAMPGLAPALAGGGPRPMQHHAVVYNGATVGSAFALAPGIAVTNAHVVRGLAPGAAVRLSPSGPQGAPVAARLLATSARMDLAVLAVPPGVLTPVPREPAPTRAGLPVVAAGVDASGTRRAMPRMELAGTVLVPARTVPAFGAGLVARMPGVRPGFSGGPLLDAEGRLVGMVTAIRPGQAASPGRPTAASGFAPRRAVSQPAEEAFVLGAGAIRAEVSRLLADPRF